MAASFESSASIASTYHARKDVEWLLESRGFGYLLS
jgi:hypothetical protein